MKEKTATLLLRLYMLAAILAAVLLILFLTWHVVPAATHAPIDFVKLRDAVCWYETRGSAKPDWAVGHDGEFGRCQIKYWTAYEIGFRGNPARLFERNLNESYALIKLIFCHLGYFGPPYRTIKGIAWCYHRGFRAGRLRPNNAYVVSVQKKYNALLQGEQEQ